MALTVQASLVSNRPPQNRASLPEFMSVIQKSSGLNKKDAGSGGFSRIQSVLSVQLLSISAAARIFQPHVSCAA